MNFFWNNFQTDFVKAHNFDLIFYVSKYFLPLKTHFAWAWFYSDLIVAEVIIIRLSHCQFIFYPSLQLTIWSDTFSGVYLIDPVFVWIQLEEEYQVWFLLLDSFDLIIIQVWDQLQWPVNYFQIWIWSHTPIAGTRPVLKQIFDSGPFSESKYYKRRIHLSCLEI